MSLAEPDAHAAFEAVLQAFPDLYFWLSADLVFLRFRAGPGAEAYLPPERFLGQRLTDVLPADPGQRLADACAQALRDGSMVSTSYALPQGERFFECRIAPLPAQELLCVVRDVTTQRQAEQRLRHYAARQETMARLVHEFASRTQDLPGLISTIVRAVGELAGAVCTLRLRSPEDGSLQVAGIHHPDPSLHRLAQRMVMAVQPGALDALWEVLMRERRPLLLPQIPLEDLRRGVRPEFWDDLARWGSFRFAVAPLVARDRALGMLSLGTPGPSAGMEQELELLQDVADRAALALENARLYAEARAAVQVREEFVTVASHELRTPINTLMLQVNALQRGKDHNVALPEEALQRIGRQVLRLERLATDLLDCSRLAAGGLELKREELELGELAREVVERMAPSFADAECQVEVQVAAKVIGLWDRTALERILMNLLGNAVRHAGSSQVWVTVGVEGAWAHLEVRDEGVGIRPEDQQRIFHRFERLTSVRKHGGLGLGLYIVQGLAQAMGGAVSVRSAPGAGATFAIRLPVGLPNLLQAPGETR